jgi:hypothetical protein
MTEITLRKIVDGLLENSKIEIHLIVECINENVFFNGVKNYD